MKLGKTMMVGLNINEEKLVALNHDLNCKAWKLLMIYIGLPSVQPLKLNHCGIEL